MTLLCGGYQAAKSPTSGPQPGAKALMSWFLGAYGPMGGLNSGIYNNRPIAGTGTLSLHAEGRACDLGIRPYSADYGWTLARALVNHSKELGIQCVIWDRHIWSSSYCDQGWRDYKGSNLHVDHLHVELSWWAAQHLTVELIQSTIGGGSSVYGTVREGAKGDAAKFVQKACRRLDPQALPKFGVDGDWGGETTTWVKKLFGGDGKVFGPDQYLDYMDKRAQAFAGKPGPAGPPGPVGPQGPAGPPGRDGIGVGAEVTITGKVVQA